MSRFESTPCFHIFCGVRLPTIQFLGRSCVLKEEVGTGTRHVTALLYMAGAATLNQPRNPRPRTLKRPQHKPLNCDGTKSEAHEVKSGLCIPATATCQAEEKTGEKADAETEDSSTVARLSVGVSVCLFVCLLVCLLVYSYFPSRPEL